jgi:hypothetical protein
MKLYLNRCGCTDANYGDVQVKRIYKSSRDYSKKYCEKLQMHRGLSLTKLSTRISKYPMYRKPYKKE